jgi:sodium-dependent dicarboxylate transporter 2/3/5
MTNSVHHIPLATISAIPIVVLTLTGIIKANDVKSLPWDTLLLVAGGLSLGVALDSTGILNHYASKLTAAKLDPVVFTFILAFITMAIANMMGPTASATLLVPLGIAVLPGMEKQIIIIIGLATSTSLIFPVSAPANAIIYSTGLVTQKDLRTGGKLMGILGPLIIILWVLFVSG